MMILSDEYSIFLLIMKPERNLSGHCMQMQNSQSLTQSGFVNVMWSLIYKTSAFLFHFCNIASKWKNLGKHGIINTEVRWFPVYRGPQRQKAFGTLKRINFPSSEKRWFLEVFITSKWCLFINLSVLLLLLSS